MQQNPEGWGMRMADEYFEVGDQSPWAFEKPTYKWREEYTEGTAPADIELESELYGEGYRTSAGKFFSEFSKVNVSRQGGPESYIPLATTGSGKTAAFLLPILSKIITKLSRTGGTTMNRPGERRSKASPMALIISPTRELAIQIFDETRRFTYQSRVRPVVIYGGTELRGQKEQLAQGCDVLIATPGRLVDSMERGAVALTSVKYLVLDEADRILDQGFEPTIRQILLSSDLPRDEGLHSMMFSATFPDAVQCLARDFMKSDYCRLRIG
ncbi:ATP-dependent RNA helicase ddx3x, partial [Modicella reniformis]